MAAEEMTDQELMVKYLNIITADYRSCYAGIDDLKASFASGTLDDMAQVFKKFFVGVAPLNLINFDELTELRPELLPSNQIFYNYNGEMVVNSEDSFKKDLCFFQKLPRPENTEINLKINAGLHCKVQATNCKMIIEVYGTSRLECYASGESDIQIILYDQGSASMVNVDQTNSVELDNRGIGAYHYREMKFNT